MKNGVRSLGVAAALALGAAAGCGYISFSRPISVDEIILRQKVEAFYTEMGLAYASGNAETLVSLYDAGISHPVVRGEIEDRAKRLFGEHPSLAFSITSLSIESLGYVQAVVDVSYRVAAPDGTALFSRTERQTLVQRRGRWYIASWDDIH